MLEEEKETAEKKFVSPLCFTSMNDFQCSTSKRRNNRGIKHASHVIVHSRSGNKVYPQSGSVEMEATHFHISPLAKFAPKTYDEDHWIKCYELFAAATEWDGLSDKVRIDMLIYILGKNAVDIYDSFKLSGEDIQFANVKQKFEDDSLIQVYYHQFLKCGDIFSEYLKFPTKKMRVKCVKPPERQIQKSMRKQD